MIKHTTMDFFDHPYYVTAKTINLLVGQWPYQKHRERKICVSLLLLLSFFDQFCAIRGIIINFGDNEIVLQGIMAVIIHFGILCKYINILYHMNTMIELINRLKESWMVHKTKDKERILKRNAHIGQFVSNGFIVLVYFTAIAMILEPVMPKCINFLFHANLTIPNRLPVAADLPTVDTEDIFYIAYCGEAFSILRMTTINVANDTMLIIILQHSCALFIIIQNQLLNLPSQENLDKDWNFRGKFRRTNDVQYEYYVMCVRDHQQAIKFAKLVEDMYTWCFGIVLTVNMLLFSVIALQLTIGTNTVLQKFKHVTFSGTLLVHLFFDCYLSQQLTNESGKIEEYIIHSNWYEMPVEVQKLAIILILRSQTPCRLTAGKIVFLSMETFVSVIKAAVSYFTVMANTMTAS